MVEVYPHPAADPPRPTDAAPHAADTPASASPTELTEDVQKQGKRRKRRRRRRFWLTALLILVMLFVAAHAALEPIVLWQVNRILDRDPLYDASVDDISISLWRGAYSVYGITLQKKTGSSSLKPLLTLDRLDLSLQWSALLEGKVVGDITMQRPVINFVDGESEAESQTGAGGPWLSMLQDLLPFTINRVKIHDGEAHFHSELGPAPIDVYLADIEAAVTDLTNVQDKITPLVTTVTVNALAMDQAPVEVKVALDPFSYYPTFELAMRMLNFDVTQINDLAQVYGAVDFKDGWFDLTVEAEATNGIISGTVKPLFRNLDVFDWEQDVEEGNIANAAWELLVGITGELLENQPRDQLGTLIQFSADQAGTDFNLLEVIGNVLRNAFIQAYLPKLRDQPPRGFTFQPAELATAP